MTNPAIDPLSAQEHTAHSRPPPITPPLFDPAALLPPLQVTNPAIDPFREAVVTSLRCFIGPEGDITTCAPSHAKRLELSQPILTLHEMAALKIINAKKWKAKVRGALPTSAAFHVNRSFTSMSGSVA